MNSVAEEAIAASPVPEAGEPKAKKKASVVKRARNVAPAKAKSGKKGSQPKKAPKGAKKAKATSDDSVRDGSKAGKILDLLKRPGGVSLKEIMKATDWQAHSVRGFLSGTIRKKMGLDVASTKGEDGERSYSVKA
jgi:hypothetical protein